MSLDRALCDERLAAPSVRRRLGAPLGALLLLTPLAEARAQAPPICFPRADLLRSLEASFGEKSAAVGLADSGSVLELVSGPEGRTWTLLSTGPEGRSCVVATGRWWVPVTGPVPGLESAFRPRP